MAVYRVVRRDDVDYDEYRAWVVRARTAKGSVRVVWETHCGDRRALGLPCDRLEDFAARVEVERVEPTGRPEVILDDFMAG